MMSLGILNEVHLNAEVHRRDENGRRIQTAMPKL
jgi:hypothetical protein